MKETKPKALSSKQEAVLQRYRRRRITLRQGAELLGISYLEMDELLREQGIPLADLPFPDEPARPRRRPAKGRA